MKSKRKTDHLERTANVVRREVCIFGLWQVYLGLDSACSYDRLMEKALDELGPFEGQPGKVCYFFFCSEFF